MSSLQCQDTTFCNLQAEYIRASLESQKYIFLIMQMVYLLKMSVLFMPLGHNKIHLGLMIGVMRIVQETGEAQMVLDSMMMKLH